MKHTWHLTDEGGERVEITLTCKFDDVIDAPLTPQYLIDLIGNAQDLDSCVSNTDHHPGLTNLACGFNIIDHAQGDQYHYVKVETEVPTVAGDWEDRSEVADVFSDLHRDIHRMVRTSGDELELDEGFIYFADGQLLA